MRRFSCLNRGMFLGAVALLLGLPAASLAQQPSPSPTPTNDTSSPQTDAGQDNSQDKKEDATSTPAVVTDNSNMEPPHAPVTPSSPLFRLGVGGLLQRNASPLRFGPIYVSSAEVAGAYNDFSSTDGTLKFAQTGTIMRADIVLDELFKNVRFTTQWEPRLTIFDGTTIGDIDNGTSSLTAKFDLTNRLRLNLSDNFSYFASRLLYGDFFMTSGVVETPVDQQNSFLNIPGHALSNTASATLSYQLSPRTNMSFSPSFNYFHTSTSTLFLNSSREYDGAFGLDYTLSNKTTIGIRYDLSAIEFQPVGTPVFYNTVTGSYAHLFSPTLSFSGSAGVSTFAPPNDARSYAFAGSAVLTKTLPRTSLSIDYVRGLDLVDYASPDFTDRVDGQVTHRLTERLSAGIGGGLQRESRQNGFRGRYAQANLNFQLTSMLSAYTLYTYSYQGGDQRFLVTGSQNLVVFGLSFRPPTIAQR